MPGKSDLLLRLGLDDAAIKRQITTLNKTLNSQFSKLGSKMESIGRDLSLRVSAPIAAIGVASVRTFAQFDKLEKGLAAISGSTEEAQRQFGNFLDIVKDTRTTLDLKSAATAALQLQSVGVSAEQAERTIRQLGIAATVSGAAADDVREIGRQLAQASSKGRIFQEELSVLLERLPALGAVIKDEFGTVTAEGLRDAGVSADEFITRLTRAIETNQKFQNVQGGISKAIETFGINLQIAGAELGKTISETIGLENALNDVSEVISRTIAAFSELEPRTKTLILAVSGLAAAIGPLSFAIGALIKTLPLLKAGLTALVSPVSLLVAGLGLLAFAIIDEYAAADAATVAQNRLNKAISEAKAATDAEKEAVAKLVQEIRSETTTKGEKARAIEELKRISPEYFGQLDIEKTKTEDLTGAVDEYNQSLQRLTLQKLNQESLEAQLELEKLNKQLELAQLTAKQTAGQFGTGAGIGVNQTITRLEKRKDELIATINALAEASKAEIDVLSKGPETIDAPTVATPTKTDIPVQVKFNLEGIGQNADNAKALFEQMDREAAIFNESLAVTQQLAQSGFAALIADDFKALSENITIAKNPLTELSESFAALEDRSLLFGDSFDLLSEKINTTKSAIQSALEEGFAPTSSTIEGLTGVLAGLTEQFEAQQAAIESTKAVTEAYTTAFNSSVNDQIKGFADVGRAALSAAAKVVKAKIQEATVSFIADAFAKFGVFGAIAAAGAGAIVGGVVSKAFSALNIPALAEGGITTGPTLALIGEGRENEVVLPLSKLNSILDNNRPKEQLIASVGIDQLYIALKRYEFENGRVN